MNWHLLDIQATMELTGSNFAGLSDVQVSERREKYGLNRLPEKKKRPVWMLFLLQFKDVMILILLAAAIVSGIASDPKDTIIILVIISLNAVVGFIQEYRAEKAIEALKKLTESTAVVKRENRSRTIPSLELVPGDIVLLELGDIVPADIRLYAVHALKVGEAALTGESQPAEKNIHALNGENLFLGDRVNMVYKGTMVNYGRGEGIVVATGPQTEIGSIAQLLQEEESRTPLQKRLADFGKKLSLVVVGICMVLYITGLLRGEDPLKMLLTAISVAVAAVPEALPAVITISLALGARKLVRKNALIRKLPAVEALGSVTYICSDKTGTLTQNKMQVQEVFAPEGKNLLNGYSPQRLLILAMLKNQDTRVDEKGVLQGDPTETAIVEYAKQQPEYADIAESFERIYEFPFDSERKLMTTIHRTGDNFLVITKGALESVLERCVDANEKEITAKAEQVAQGGLRIIAYACKIISSLAGSPVQQETESDLHFTGFIGEMDPPRPEVRQAVEACKLAGINPVMITGDHPVTAMAIARQTGILFSESDKVITGSELAELSQKDLEEIIEKIKIYARVSPEQKLRIVKTLQDRNQYVAMTGDGVNDAPALRRANIGVAMGITGTDVSKEAAHMILLDDNFATIVKAVEEGRRILDNTRKFIKYVLTCNGAEIWTIFLAPLVGLPIPLLPVHILWINLVTDGLPGLALAGEPAEKDIMRRKPCLPGESIFARGMGIHILWVGLLMGAICLVTQAWAIQSGNEKWQTIVFTVLCMSQMGHVMAVRSEKYFLFNQGLFSNLPLLGAVLLTFLLQLAIIYIPALQSVFSTQPLYWKELAGCLLVSAIIFHIVELEKLVKHFKTSRESQKVRKWENPEERLP